jgi:hypothetical protein
MIRKLESSDLTFNQLKDLLGPKQSKQTRFLTYDQLAPFKSFEQLFKGYKACVVLLIPEINNNPKSGHFIALLDHGTHVEHFDSYGLDVDEEMKITKEHHLTQLFNKEKRPLVQNSKKLQRFANDINTCGRWVVARILLSSMELEAFLKLIESLGRANDEMITAMTLLLPFKY